MKQDWIRNRRVRVFETHARLELAGRGEGRKVDLRTGRRLLRKMHDWRGQFGYRSVAYWLVLAEYERVRGRMPLAARAYEAAIRQKQDEWQGVFRPLSYERMGLFYEQTGMEAGAMMALVEAAAGYRASGHIAKVERMQKQYMELAIYDQLQTYESVDECVPDAQPLRSFPAEEQVEWQARFGFKTLSAEELITACCRFAGADNGTILEGVNDTDFSEVARYGRAVSEGISYLSSMVKAQRLLETAIIVEDVQNSFYRVMEEQPAYIHRCSAMSMPIRLAWSKKPMVLYMENSMLAGAFTQQTAIDVEEIITKLSYLQLFHLQTSSMQHQSVSRPPQQVKEESLTVALEPLTAREEEVLLSLVDGKSNKEIAEHLYISETTAE